jgi:uncharacterized protein (TIGR02246 family)
MNDDERQIRELVATWMAASAAGDLPTVLALMADDMMFMTPGRPPFGKKEFAANSEQMRGMTMDGHCDVQEVEVFGDRAYVRNHIQITLTKPGEPPMRLSGHTLGILRKEADGCWRLARDANLVMPEPS